MAPDMLARLLRPMNIVTTAAIGGIAVLVRKSRGARFAYHLTLYASSLGVASIWGVAVSVVATLVGQRFNINYIVARSFYHLASPLVGIRIKVEGEEHLKMLTKGTSGSGQSAVLIGNHQSFLDILYLGRILPKRSSIMAKKELFWMPLLGQFMAASGAVFVDRKSRSNALTVMAKAGETMKRRGISLWVFPEGTRSSRSDPTLLPFKKGAFHLAVQAQVPIIPVVCENYHRLFDGKSRMERGTLRLRVLAPISTAGLSPDDVTNLTESTREIMLAALIEISQPDSSSLVLGSASSSTTLRLSESDLSKAETGQSSGMQTPTSAAFSHSGESTGSASLLGSNGGESEEEEEVDEEEDAVLLKRPKPIAEGTTV